MAEQHITEAQDETAQQVVPPRVTLSVLQGDEASAGGCCGGSACSTSN